MASPMVTAPHRHDTRIAVVGRWALFLAAVSGLILTGLPVVLR